MARFRAYSSSEDESEPEPEPQPIPKKAEPIQIDDETDEELEEDSDEDSSSSELHEDDLVSSPSRRTKRPTRNALVEDEDGEIHYAHEMETSQSPPPVNGINRDPTIIPWAQQIGVDAQKMHVMQASLFRVPEEAAALKAINSNQPPTRHIRFQTPKQSRNRKHGRDSDGDNLRFEPRERASFAHDVDPLPYRPSRKYARVDTSDSSVKGTEGAMIDAGLALGRSFRVGWGPGGTLVHSGRLCGSSTLITTTANSSIITKTTIPIFSSVGADPATLSAKLLQHHLSNSPILRDEDGIPFANPSPALDFFSFASLFASADNSNEASLFRLGNALFDPLDLHLHADVSSDTRYRISTIRRKAALSSWLENAVLPSVGTSLKDNPAASPVFTLLTGNQIDKACDAAIEEGNVKLATLIAQAGGDEEFKEDLMQQLNIWKEQKLNIHINEDVRKVYALLAGCLNEEIGSANVTTGLDWKRTFGLYLWFAAPVDASIAQVFDAFISSSSYAKPRPWYIEGSHSCPPPSWNVSSYPPDMLFSLIRLSADPALSLSHTLHPMSYGGSPIDCGLSWHLYILLSRCMRVRDFVDRDGGRGFSVVDEGDETVEGHSPSADLLASSYAFQLESLGMVQEALFVLLHIEGSVGREKAIKDLLARSAPKFDDWMVRGMVGSLRIPMAWIDEAKAIYALDSGNVYDAYELYISARMYNQAHELAVLELAPDAVIRKDLEVLKDLFERIKNSRVPVDGWHVRGKAFLDYANIMTRLPLLQDLREADATPDAAEATELDELTRSVPKLIGILPDVLRDYRSDPRHKAALAEMVKGLMGEVDRVRPLVLSQNQVQSTYTLVDDATKIRHIHSTAYDRFLKTIEVV